MRDNPIKTALREGRAAIGSEISRFRCTEVVRIYAKAGFEFVFIDMEHTPFSLETVSDMIQTARTADIVPLVRVPQAERVWVARALDAGAQGVIVPRVNTADVARELVSWSRYPPAGTRGFAQTPNQTDDEPTEPQAFIDWINNHVLIVIQIERILALEQLDEILSVDGIDVACVGYMDLSVDMGLPGQLNHPRMVAGLEKIIATANQHGVTPGIICPDLSALRHWAERGMRFISYGTDGQMLQQAAECAVNRLRTLHNTVSETQRQKPPA